MVAVIAGDIYCCVIEACHETFDLRRSQEWTAALSAWCDAQPDLVLYRGQCLVHRASIMQLHGTWSEAMDETSRACERLAQPPGQPARRCRLLPGRRAPSLAWGLILPQRRCATAANLGNLTHFITRCRCQRSATPLGPVLARVVEGQTGAGHQVLHGIWDAHLGRAAVVATRAPIDTVMPPILRSIS